MKHPSRSLARLWTDCVQLGMEAQSVIGLRMAKMAWGGSGAHAEARRMVAEKISTAIEVQGQIASRMISGRSHLAPDEIVRLYRRRVRVIASGYRAARDRAVRLGSEEPSRS